MAKRKPRVRWTQEELNFIKLSIKRGIKPWKIKLKGRSKIAIRNQCIRSKIWKTRRRAIKCWTMPEINKLRSLIQDHKYTAKVLFERDFFPGRSEDSISQQMRRSKIKRKI